MTSEELKACPFCGGEPFHERADYSSCYIICNDCSARGPVSCDETEADAEASENDTADPGEMAAKRLWNTRASEQPAIVAGMVPWHGGDSAPGDWNGGRVLLASGEVLHPYQTDDEFDWERSYSETGCIEPGNIIAYTPRARPSAAKDEQPAIVEGERVTLEECPPGLFLSESGHLGFKSEYRMHNGEEMTRWPDAYVVASGEVFWGGAKSHDERAALFVRPIDDTDLILALSRPPSPQTGLIEALAAEREACARDAEEVANTANVLANDNFNSDYNQAVRDGANLAAATIRARTALLATTSPDQGEDTLRLSRLAQFMGEQEERDAAVEWLRKVGDSKKHGTDWRSYYEIADAIELGTHRAATDQGEESGGR